MLPRGAYCVVCLHNMLPREHFVYPSYTIYYQSSILCRVYNVISVVFRGYTICSSHVLNRLSFLSTHPFTHPSVYLLNRMSKVVSASYLYYIIVVHPLNNISLRLWLLTRHEISLMENGETPEVKCKNVVRGQYVDS